MSTKKSSVTTIALAIVAALLLIALGVGAYFMISQSGGAQLADPQMQEVPSSTSETTTEQEEEKKEDKKKEQRPEDPDLPSAAAPVNPAARNGEPAGNFNNVYLSGPTSEEFALIVRDEFVDQYLDTKRTTAVVQAYSPTTEQSYSMDCQDKGSYVHCTGGNNANVYIA